MASGWELVAGEAARDIERLNRSSQWNVMLALVRLMLDRAQRDGRAPPAPDKAALQALHRAGTLFLLAEPGEWRRGDVDVARGRRVAHRPPGWFQIDALMDRFFEDLERIWVEGDALDAAGFALWRICWIHPFRDGNGAAANAFAYACLCLKLGALLPGEETLVDEMRSDPGPREAALKAADSSLLRGAADLGPMKAYLDGLLLRQIRRAEAATAPQG